MSFIEFIISNSKSLPIEIINKAQLSGWDKSTLFMKLKEQGEYISNENGEYIVSKTLGKLTIPEKYDIWLEKRIGDMLSAI